jgi:ribonuclease VapC
MIMRGRRPDGLQDLDDLIATLGIELTRLDLSQAHLARKTFASYGKGNHPAGLNLGDLFAYALAKHLNEPLLFKGNDFSRTDITPA